MKIGIIGAGLVGTTLAAAFKQVGHDVLLSYSRNPDQLQERATQLGVQAGTPAEAAAFADVLVFAPRFANLADAATQVGPVAGKLVIDATNPYDFETNGVVDLHGQTAMAKVTEALPGARLVKAFNSLGMAQFTAERGKGKVLFLAGDEAAANTTVAQLLAAVGFEPVSVGGAAQARLTELPGPMFMQIYSRAEAETRLADLS